MRVAWSRAAIADLSAARAHIARDDPRAAADVARRLVEATDMLADFPAMGRPGKLPHTRELLVPGTPYFLPYRVRNDEIQIIAVVHMSRQWLPR